MIGDGVTDVLHCESADWDPQEYPIEPDADPVYCEEQVPMQHMPLKPEDIKHIVKEGRIVSTRTGCPIRFPKELEGKKVGVMEISKLNALFDDAQILRAGGCFG